MKQDGEPAEKPFKDGRENKELENPT